MMSFEFFENTWVYDLETYPNIFTLCAVYGNGKGIRVFEVSDRKNESVEILDFLRKVRKANHSMVGFNNIGFDYPLLDFIMKKAMKFKSSGSENLFQLSALELYREAQRIIDEQNGEFNQFSTRIKETDHLIKQIDLYKIHHFDNRAKATSLKMLEFVMRSDTIEDLPFPIGKSLDNDEKDLLIQYNKHDVLQTLKFLNLSNREVLFRNELKEKFGFDCTNFNDPKIGAELFVQRLEDNRKGSCYREVDGKRVMMQTKRKSIKLDDVILPYVNFKRPEFNAVLEWLRNKTIYETKGVFSDLEEKELMDIPKYAEMKTKKVLLKNDLLLDSKGKPRDYFNLDNEQQVEKLESMKMLFLKKYPQGYFTEIDKSTKSERRVKVTAFHRELESLHVMVDGLSIVFGLGGIHAARGNTVFTESDNTIIESVDVASMYPNLSIRNRLFPEHLDINFCTVYEDLFNERRLHDKKSAMNAILKLALNGVYGKSNDKFSPFYDPKFTMSITLGGQLSLCMLAEKLLEIPTVKILMMNTDGLEYIIDKEYVDQGREVCSNWEKLTKLELERVNYSKLIIRDVNNYIAVYTNGDVKRKGAYEYENLTWNKNHSMLVVKKAAEYEILGKGSVEDFIIEHKDMWDFFGCTKVPRSSSLVLEYDTGLDVTQEKQQNICRYIVAKNGGQLVKIMPPLKEGSDLRRMNINNGLMVKTCNNVIDFKWEDLNYQFYIDQARKLINAVDEDEEGEETDE